MWSWLGVLFILLFVIIGEYILLFKAYLNIYEMIISACAMIFISSFGLGFLIYGIEHNSSMVILGIIMCILGIIDVHCIMQDEGIFYKEKEIK